MYGYNSRFALICGYSIVIPNYPVSSLALFKRHSY